MVYANRIGLNPILIRVYPRKWGWPDLSRCNSNLSNSHSPSRSIHGILLLQTNTLALLHLRKMNKILIGEISASPKEFLLIVRIMSRTLTGVKRFLKNGDIRQIMLRFGQICEELSVLIFKGCQNFWFCFSI